LPPFRRQGLGENLMRQALAAARAFGLHRVEVTVRKSNKNAIELYKKVGFAIEGLQRDAIRVDGNYENVISMALLL
jgi:ribosomal protein S18 acetylase RimI-like enzyme